MGTTKKTKKKSTQPKLRASRRTNSKKVAEQKKEFLRNEVLILVLLAVCIFLQISHFGICGYIGNSASAILFGLFGLLAYITPILVFILVTFVMSNKGNKDAYVKIVAVALLYIMCCTLFQLILGKEMIGKSLGAIYKSCSVHRDSGGILGGALANVLYPAVGMVGTYIIVIVLSIISFVILTGKSFVGAMKKKSQEVLGLD